MPVKRHNAAAQRCPPGRVAARSKGPGPRRRNPKHPDRRLLRYIAEYGALPVDLAAALMRRPEREIAEMIQLGKTLDWIRTVEYPGEPSQWVALYGKGWARAGYAAKKRRLPARTYLAHRREVVEARLLLRAEKPGWTWISEAEFGDRCRPSRLVPDGVLRRGQQRWAIEVERSPKPPARLRARLIRLTREYSKVVYFASPVVTKRLARIQATGACQNLELRPLPGQTDSPPTPRQPPDAYEPSPAAREMLRVINEEGLIAMAQLPRILRWSPAKLSRTQAELESNHCLRRGLELNRDKGWIWCNSRGATRSGTNLHSPVVPSRGSLVKKIVLTEIRLELLGRWPGGTWISQRRLRQGKRGALPCLPDAVFEREGGRYAVVVLERRRDRQRRAEVFRRWNGEYTGVLCYRTKPLASWLDGLLAAYELDGVEVRDLPQPPASSPYRTLEEDSAAAREEGQANSPKKIIQRRPSPDSLSAKESNLLWLASTEGALSELQLPRILGCPDSAVKRLVVRLDERRLIDRAAGWVYCTTSGNALSGTGLKVAFKRADKGLDELFELMELRLALGEPVSRANWKTRRQLGKEVGASGSAVRRLPHAVMVAEDQWLPVAVFLKDFWHGRSELLTNWNEAFERVRCFCRTESLAGFERFLDYRALSSLEAAALPTSPDKAAQDRQAAIYARLRAEEVERAIRNKPRERARRMVVKAVHRGKLYKPDHCQGCGKRVAKARLHGHHEDYSRPLEVEWLCTDCHPPKDRARARREACAA